jgi:hypothetical protein
LVFLGGSVIDAVFIGLYFFLKLPGSDISKNLENCLENGAQNTGDPGEVHLRIAR